MERPARPRWRARVARPRSARPSRRARAARPRPARRNKVFTRPGGSSSRIAGPAQRPGIYKIHGTAVRSPGTGVSLCKVVVVTMGAIATSVAIAERNGPRISSPNHWQSPQDGGYGQNVHNLLPRKCLVDQFRATLGDPRLWQRVRDHQMFMLLHIITA
jgi:hypothetical protein